MRLSICFQNPYVYFILLTVVTERHYYHAHS